MTNAIRPTAVSRRRSRHSSRSSGSRSLLTSPAWNPAGVGGRGESPGSSGKPAFRASGFDGLRLGSKGMTPDDERIALFLDYENLAIGARESVGGGVFDFRPIADALAERGRVVVRRA